MRKYIALIFTCISFLLVGCSNAAYHETFYNRINEIYTNIQVIDTKMNEIDPTAADASVTMLSLLNELEGEFQKLANVTPPSEEYNYVTELALEGYEYMEQALDLYYGAIGNPEFDEASFELANDYYERACKRSQIILSLLKGIVPDNVAVTYE